MSAWTGYGIQLYLFLIIDFHLRLWLNMTNYHTVLIEGIPDISSKRISPKRNNVWKTFRLNDISSKRHFAEDGSSSKFRLELSKFAYISSDMSSKKDSSHPYHQGPWLLLLWRLPRSQFWQFQLWALDPFPQPRPSKILNMSSYIAKLFFRQKAAYKGY